MKAETQRRLRQYHNWLGLFFAPAILFFAFSGLIQTIGWQDKRPGYTPPGWINVIASLHKNQVVQRHRPPGPPPAAPARPAAALKPAGGDEEAFVPLKIFVLLLALSLITTTLFGITIALANRARRRTTWLLLGAGVVVPLVLMAL